MSNLWLNLRFWYWHLQWSYDNWLPRISKNYFLWGRGLHGMKKIENHSPRQ